MAHWYLGECTAVFSSCLFLFSLIIASVFVARPRKYVDENFSCSNTGDIEYDAIQGIPFVCGWHELRPGSDVYAFLQPSGSLCQSNAGYVRGNRTGAGLLIDTLTDPVLTAGMLKALPGRSPGAVLPVTGIIYTHPDIDHVAGNQVLPSHIPRFGHEVLNDELPKFTKQRTALLTAIGIGHFIWSAAELIGWRELVRALPELLREAALSALGWAYIQAALAKFNFYAIADSEGAGLTQSLPAADDAIDLELDGVPGPVRFAFVGALHSSSDSVVLLPAARVCFAGDLLFAGVAPVMWAGTAAAWAAALDALLARTGDGWIFVGGHGPPTGAAGVRRLRDYLVHLDAAVTSLCPAAPDEAGRGHAAEDAACAARVYRELPPDLRAAFAEPERILISAQVDRMARRGGGRASVSLATKVLLFSRTGAEALRRML